MKEVVKIGLSVYGHVNNQIEFGQFAVATDGKLVVKANGTIHASWVCVGVRGIPTSQFD